MTNLLETLVRPSSGGTQLCSRVKTSVMGCWQSSGLKKANIGIEKGISVPKMAQAQMCVVTNDDQPKILEVKKIAFY